MGISEDRFLSVFKDFHRLIEDKFDERMKILRPIAKELKYCDPAMEENTF